MAAKRRTGDDQGGLTILVTIALVIAALYFAKEILLPLALAILLSFILTPLVARLEHWSLGRVLSVVVAVALAFSAIGAVGWLTAYQMIELGNRLPQYKYNLISKIHTVQSGTDGKLGQAKKAIEDIGKELTKGDKNEDQPDDAQLAKLHPDRTPWPPWVSPQASLHNQRTTNPGGDASEKDDAVAVKVVELPPSPLSQIKTWLGPLVAPLSTAGIVIVLVVFILFKREDLRNRVIQLIGTSTLYATTEAIEDATNRLSRYLRMQLLINTIYGVVVATGLTLIGVPNAILWGVLGTLLRFLPYLGPWAAATMPIVLSLAALEGWVQPLCTIGLFLSLEFVVNNILEPWLYGSSIGVSSLGVILAAIFWTWLWGPIGLVLAMPVTVCSVVLGNYIPQLRFLPILLGDGMPLAPHEQMYQRLLAADDFEAGKLADEYVRSGDGLGLYDQLLIPALQLAERDRHAGALSARREKLVLETAQELMEDLEVNLRQPGQNAADTPHDSASSTFSPRILCVPAHDDVDGVATAMLDQWLRHAGFPVESGSLNLLASEMIARVQTEQIDIAVVVIVPPLGSRNGRYLCRRLRQSHPDLAIVAALFQGAPLQKTQQRLQEAGADIVANSLSDAVDAIRRIARQLSVTRCR